MLVTLGASQTGFAIEVRDDEGSLVQLDASAQRIISLAPSLTELLYAAGAGDKLVGVVEYSDYPVAAQALPIIGRHDLLDMEKILQLQPDLIIAWQTGNPRASVNRLRELGLTVYIAEPKRLESITSHIRRLAILAGTEQVAAGVIDDFETAETILPLAPGDRLFLYTDGLSETTNEEKELLGDNQILDIVRDHRHDSLDVALDRKRVV